MRKAEEVIHAFFVLRNEKENKNYMKKLLTFVLFTLLLFACGGGDDGGGNTPSGGSEFLNVSNVDVAGSETTAKLSIQASANCDWQVSCNESWVSNIAPSSGRGNRDVTITLSGVNPSSSSSRIATIMVRNSSGTITRTVTLTQAANKEYIEISGDATINFGNKADARTIPIRSNTQWSVAVAVITGSSDWIQVSPNQGSNDGSITLTVKDNNTLVEQKAKLTIMGTGGTTKELTVVQSAASAPTLTLPQFTDITTSEANVYFTFDSAIPVTSCGICYATTQKTPDVKQDALVAATSTTSPVVVRMTGLTSGTTYYVYGYVITSEGTAYYSEAATLTTVSRWPNEDDVVTPN